MPTNHINHQKLVQNRQVVFPIKEKTNNNPAQYISPFLHNNCCEGNPVAFRLHTDVPLTMRK